jgi:pimeloyl-ACP methyl ester carboxylesterase
MESKRLMPATRPRFVLIHSPLVGPGTWEPVAAALVSLGAEAIVPELHDEEGAGLPSWQQHAHFVARALASLPPDRGLIFVGHSGAGPILPAIAESAAQPVAAYLFVDAGLPRAGATRLDLLRAESPELAASLRAMLLAGGHYPEWSDADLRPLVPDAQRRRRLLAELHPRGHAFWEEAIPVFAAWPDAPCAYLELSRTYAQPAAGAERLGWPVRKLEGGHFLMLVDPLSVAEALLDLAARSRVRAGP